MKTSSVIAACLLAVYASGCSNPSPNLSSRNQPEKVSVAVDTGREYKSIEQSEVLAQLKKLGQDIGGVDTKVDNISNRVGVVEQRLTKLEVVATASPQLHGQMPLDATVAAATHLASVREALGVNATNQQIGALQNQITGMVINTERERADDAERRAAEAEFQLKIIEGKTYVEQAALHQHFQAPGCAVIDPVYGSLREFYATESVWRGGLYPGRYGGYW